MIYTGLNRTGEIADIKAHGGNDISEVYGGIGESNPIYYKHREMVGTSPMQFKALGQPLKDYHIFGETVQDGTPSPDMPVDVVSVGDLVTSGEHAGEYCIQVTADDLYSDAVLHSRGVGITARGYRYSLANIIGNVGPNTKQIKIASNTKYVISFDTDDNVITSDFIRFALTTVDLSIATLAYDIWTFQNGENGDMLQPNQHYEFYIENTNYKFLIIQSNFPACVKNIKIHETWHIYLSEPLRKIGDYADEIDFKTGTVTRRISNGKKFDGTEYWSNHDYGSRPFMYTGITGYKENGLAVICSHYKSTENCLAHQLPFKSCAFIPSNIFHELYISNYKFGTDVTAFKKFLAEQYAAGTPVTVYYVFKTPTTESITLPTITPTPGSNTLSIGTALQPSQVSIAGHIKPSSTYGQLLDVNNQAILDKNGDQIFVYGQS